MNADGRVIVEESLEGRYQQSVRAGRHTLTADEPIASGGDDAGPGPYDFILIGLGACKSMTVRMYAELKKIPLQRVRVELSHQKVHAQDCADCDTKEGKIDEISCAITFEGELSADQRQRLLEIADRCPVHRTLTSEIKIRTQLA